LRLGADDGSAFSAYSSSSSGNPNNKTFAQARIENKQRQQQQQQQQQQEDFLKRQSSPRSSGLFGTLGQPMEFSWLRKEQPRFQAAAQSPTVPRPDLNNVEECLAYLGFGEIPTIDELNERVVLIRQNPQGRTPLDIATVRDVLEGIITPNNGDNFELGGKRQTMKVKKHFRKTRNIHSKRVKKTRLRRNNKSKRVLKEKRRR
jgi:hypothetical protein